MDDYTARVTEPLRTLYAEFQADDATLLDLSRVASQVAMTLDNAQAELLALLRQADGDLEYGATTRRSGKSTPRWPSASTAQSSSS